MSFVYNADLSFNLVIFFGSVVLMLLCLQISGTGFFMLTWVMVVGCCSAKPGIPLGEQNQKKVPSSARADVKDGFNFVSYL